MMVNVGLAKPYVGNTEAPATYRLGTPCTRQFSSTTPDLGSWAMRVVPIWCHPPPMPSIHGTAAMLRGNTTRPTPAAANASPSNRTFSRTDTRSCSDVRQSRSTIGSPIRSRWLLSRTRLSRLGDCSDRTLISNTRPRNRARDDRAARPRATSAMSATTYGVRLAQRAGPRPNSVASSSAFALRYPGVCVAASHSMGAGARWRSDALKASSRRARCTAGGATNHPIASAPLRLIVERHVHSRRHLEHAAPHVRMLGEIPPHQIVLAADVRRQQQPGILDRARRQHEHARPHAAPSPVERRHTHPANRLAVRVAVDRRHVGMEHRLDTRRLEQLVAIRAGKVDEGAELQQARLELLPRQRQDHASSRPRRLRERLTVGRNV